MSEKEKILSRIRGLRPTESPLPEIPLFRDASACAFGDFESALKLARARILECPESSLAEFIARVLPGRLWSCVAEVPGDAGLMAEQEPARLDGVEVALVRADFGVAENGAMWIGEEDLKMPVVPFIARHLVVLLDRKDIVADMHAAYARIKLGAYPFGVFIAGPSKTADIEQSMVIGAHGPLGLTVLVK